MRVVIVGLDSAQASLIEREYRRHFRLRIFHEDARRTASVVADAVAHADRAFIMTRFVGHDFTASLDNQMVTPIHGGLAKLREALNSVVKHLPPPPAPVHKPLPPPPPHTPLAPLLMAGLKQNDFSALKTAKPGEVLAFKRPHNVGKDVFERQVANSRSNYRTRYGVHTSMEWAGDEIHVLVEKVAPAEPTAPDKETETEVAAPATQAADTPPPATASSESIALMDRRFWQEVYLQAQRDRYPAPQCEAFANAAIDALHQKLGRA